MLSHISGVEDQRLHEALSKSFNLADRLWSRDASNDDVVIGPQVVNYEMPKWGVRAEEDCITSICQDVFQA